MSNFRDMLNEVLFEKEKSFKDLENANILGKKTFYGFKDFSPLLPTVIKICNYLEVSLDYLAGRTNENNFKRYRVSQTNFYNNLTNIIKTYKISQNKLSKEVPFSQCNFTYWKQGSLPKFSTLIRLADYFNCSIDDFLDLE